MEMTANWMALLVLSLFAVSSSFTISGAATVDYQQRVYSKCAMAKYPVLCVTTLMNLNHQPDDFISALVNKSLSESKLPTSYFHIPTSQLDTQSLVSKHSRFIADHCTELMSMSQKRLDQALMALKESPTTNKEDIQTWVSAALTFQDACKDSADNLGLSPELTRHISDKMGYLAKLGSNVLSLVNNLVTPRSSKKKVTKNRNGDEEHSQFPGWVSMRDRELLQSTDIKANVMVAKDGSGNYETISEAISAASGNRFVIYVKAGVYKEKIRTNKDGITLMGDGKYSTIITGDDSVNGGSSMPGSATFTVTGDGFIARDIGFQNTAGPDGRQALAIYVSSDHSVFFRCSIAGYQDTVYAMALRQFYRECDIYGTIDFLFGNAAAVFQSCSIILRKPRHGSSYNVIVAHGRTDPGQNTGFVLQHCRIVATSDYFPLRHSVSSYLGRPWKKYSRAVVMESSLDDSVSSRGWVEWPGAGSYAKTLYFAEYANSGPGAATSQRVNWPGFHVIGGPEASKFTVGNFISGSSWLPSTGVTFVSGLQ